MEPAEPVLKNIYQSNTFALPFFLTNRKCLWPAKKLQFSLINVTYFFIFVTNFHSHLLNFSFKQCSSFGKLDQLFISFKMIYNMTIFEKKFFLSYQWSKVNFYPFPIKPQHMTMSTQDFLTRMEPLASSAGFVSQLKNSYRIIARDRTILDVLQGSILYVFSNIQKGY